MKNEELIKVMHEHKQILKVNLDAKQSLDSVWSEIVRSVYNSIAENPQYFFEDVEVYQ